MVTHNVGDSLLKQKTSRFVSFDVHFALAAPTSELVTDAPHVFGLIIANLKTFLAVAVAVPIFDRCIQTQIVLLDASGGRA